MKEKNEYDEKESLPKKNYCGKVMEGIKVIKRFLAINFSRRFIGNRGAFVVTSTQNHLINI